MALDALAEIAVRAVGNFILEVVIVKIFYWPGWLILRIVTLGRYPPPEGELHNREVIGLVGFLTIVISFLLTLPGG